MRIAFPFLSEEPARIRKIESLSNPLNIGKDIKVRCLESKVAAMKKRIQKDFPQYEFKYSN